MSACFVLLPLAIAIIASSAEGLSHIADACANIHGGRSEKMPTKFNSEELLKATLTEHGVPLRETSPGCIVADFGTGKIAYERSSQDAPYTMQVFDVQDMDGVLCSIRDIEEEYGDNVQSYTYRRVKENLPSDMCLQSEEILEDNSILLTLVVN